MSESCVLTKLPFLGDRDYLHGSSLFGVMSSFASPEALCDIDFTFFMRTVNQVEIAEAPPPDKTTLVATFTCSDYTRYAISTAVPIVERVPYDERKLVDTFIQADDRLIVKQTVSDPFEKVVIAAFKAIVKGTYPSQRAIFARLRTRNIPTEDFSVRYSRTIGGRFHEGTIEQHDSSIGSIFFGIWQ